ncbi:MAG: DoxX family protein [Candidatus Dactylopiibacterium sp.]|nr:DoxX family protein [Candidatus Dactylopiibacterium sp.]
MNANFQNRSGAYAAFVLRVALGVFFLAHVATKIFVFTVPGTVGFFASLGLPPIAAYLTIFGELFGGIALLAGFRTRLVAALTLPLLAGVIWAHAGNGWSFSAPKGGWEYPVFVFVAASVQALLGAGAWSWDESRRGATA